MPKNPSTRLFGATRLMNFSQISSKTFILIPTFILNTRVPCGPSSAEYRGSLDTLRSQIAPKTIYYIDPT